MMVTFVSECEKKALPKTRRVLDAFANRIGTRTWQTVITEEGLIAVKKLLRKTASKNTAVSCHWIRSRSRSELQWVIGNQDMFNTQGVVPVNYTHVNNAMIDEIRVMTDKIYANTAQQPLDQHLFAVGYLASRLSRNFVSNDDSDKQALANFVAGALHDIGKIDPQFQSWVHKESKKKKLPAIPEEGQHIERGKFSFEHHPRHNEISLLLYYLLNDEAYKKINRGNKDQIKHAVFWHHAKPYRKTDFKKLETVYSKLKKNIGDGAFTELLHVTKQVLSSVNQMSLAYDEEPLLVDGLLSELDEDRLYDLAKESFPAYKEYLESNDDVADYRTNICKNAHHNISRSSVITADRLVSALTRDDLDGHIQNKTLDTLLEKALLEGSQLTPQITECIEGFETRYPSSERNEAQAMAAKELHELGGVGVLNGPAGCGKTKIALEWAALGSAKKIIWVCPRVQVCQGLLNDLTDGEYLPSTKIEINTGEFKSIYQSGEVVDTPEGQEFSGDIVLTTIDQIVNQISTHNKVTGLVQYMNAHVVFDEYHEYINMPAFNLLFAELVECKKLQGTDGRALLVSATPNYYFLEELLRLYRDDVVGIESFNTSEYRIETQSFDEAERDDNNPLYAPQPKNTFVISNTAVAAQSSFIRNQETENAILLHSKYTKADKQDLFEKVIDSFSKNGTTKFDVLRSGPVVQASLNITCDQMVTEFTSAENWLQRLGRLDRFGVNSDENRYITAIPKSLVQGKQTGRCARFLNSLFSLQSAKAWHAFLQDNLGDDSVTVTELYELYSEFYDDEKCKDAVEEDLKRALKRSNDVINLKLLDPIFISRKKVTADSTVKIKKHSLRGDSRFVQMAVCNFSPSGDMSFPDQYAYDENDFEANLTESVEKILGYGKSDKDLLSFMFKKHHNIKGVAKAHNDNVLLNDSRSPETPIYLSYTTSDLEAVGGASVAHQEAIYYGQSKSQPIGAISINKFRNKEV